MVFKVFDRGDASHYSVMAILDVVEALCRQWSSFAFHAVLILCSVDSRAWCAAITMSLYSLPALAFVAWG